jgi:hypothetical protein
MRIALVFSLLALFLTACAGSATMPDWVHGPKAKAYPDDQFMIGVGQGDSRAIAEDRAYAALARIFKVDVTSQSKDWESYVNMERTGNVRNERRLMVETLTKVSTDKLLENAKIADTWQDPRTQTYSALAVLHRSSTRALLSSRIAELDDTIDRDLKTSQETTIKLLKLRGLHRAARNLLVRDSFNQDLRVVAGSPISTQVSIAAVSQELEKFLRENLTVTVDVRGDQADSVRQAIIETLLREGLPVSTVAPGDPKAPDLAISGETRLWPVDLPDPKFRYVRWCADFVMLSSDSRIVGGVARSGREGHLTYREASNRALRSLQEEVTTAIVKAFNEQIYGDVSTVSAVAAACPRH